MTKLPVWPTVTQAYRALWAHRWSLLHRAAVPLVLFVAIHLAARSIQSAVPQPYLWLVTGWWYRLAVDFLALGPLVLFFVQALRLFLPGQPSPGGAWPLPLSPSVLKLMESLWPYPFSPAAIRVMGYFALLLVVKAAFGFVSGTVVLFAELDALLTAQLLSWSWLIVNLIVLYGLLRLSFLPIRLVLDRRADLRARWRETSGNGPRLLLAMLLAQLPVYLLNTAAIWVVAYTVQSDQRLFWLALGGLDWLLTLVVWAAVTVAAFATLTGRPAEGLEAPAGPEAPGPGP